jgi:hypothetical protein
MSNMHTTDKSTRRYESHEPPVAGIRIMDSARILWFSELLKDTDRVSIGRTRQRDVRIFDRTVSREHCELVRDPDGTYHLIDRGSTNGLHVSPRGKYSRYRRVDRVRLEVGMHIDVGDVTVIPVDENGACPITVTRYSELLRLARAIYGSAAEAARHIGKRSQQVILRAVGASRPSRKAS